MNMKKLLALLLALTLSLTGLCAAAEQDEDVVLATAYGGKRILTKLTGAQLPRIC